LKNPIDLKAPRMFPANAKKADLTNAGTEANATKATNGTNSTNGTANSNKTEEKKDEKSAPKSEALLVIRDNSR